MDQQSFEDALKRAGFEEITTKVTLNEKHNREHSHPFEVRAMVIQGALTLTWDGQTKTFKAGDIFTMRRGCPHAESYGPEGAVILSGRKH
jgi:quercetin dioxygenase-like cupin family protein